MKAVWQGKGKNEAKVVSKKGGQEIFELSDNKLAKEKLLQHAKYITVIQ